MKVYSMNYRKQEGHPRGTLINRGFWVHGIPRLIPLCRVFGHEPVVDGAGQHRWVTCDRCGVRTQPQGPIDEDLVVGQPYTDELPGPWPADPSGTIGGQVVIGRTSGGGSVQFRVGCKGDEEAVAAHLRLGPIGALYLHTEWHGTWLQRRLIPVDFQSRVTGLSIADGRLRWDLWAKEHEWSSSDPKWQQGSIRIDPRDILLGERRYSYVDVGEKVVATVRMPHGDDHEVALQLQRCSLGRKRGRKAHSWSVKWGSREGIPVRTDDDWKGDSYYGSSVKVSDSAVENGSWPYVASSAIADDLMGARVRYGWEPKAA